MYLFSLYMFHFPPFSSDCGLYKMNRNFYTLNILIFPTCLLWKLFLDLYFRLRTPSIPKYPLLISVEISSDSYFILTPPCILRKTLTDRYWNNESTWYLTPFLQNYYIWYFRWFLDLRDIYQIENLDCASTILLKTVYSLVFVNPRA